MAYTNVWTTTVPTGAEAVATADNEIRKLRLDIEERMESFGFDWGVDPVTMTTTKYQYLSFSSFFLQTVGGATIGFGSTPYGISATGGTAILHAPVIIPRGNIITGMSVTGVTTVSSTADCVFYVVDATTGTVTETAIASINLPAPSSQGIFSAATFTHTIDSTPANYKYYAIKVTLAGAGGGLAAFQGVRLSYTSAAFAAI